MRKSSDPFFVDEPGDNMDVENTLDSENVVGDMFAFDPNNDVDFSLPGTAERRRQKDMQDIQLVMERTGWAGDLHMQLPIPVPGRFKPLRLLSATEWKGQIQQLKQKVLDDRQKSWAHGEVFAANDDVVTTNVVKIIDKSHLERRHHSIEHKYAIDKLCEQYLLNEEQERAFKIVANHAVVPFSEQLKMYIGGMGGTGKSQVLNAISAFFSQHNEAFHFLIVAPTGSAAALLAGSTYHSMLGINEKTGGATNKALAQVRTRLAGVDYIFLDEVSMLSSHSLYKISAQLCRVMNQLETAFGGVNMIFAGDFGQLPPSMGGENVSLYS
jgi:hypothetical protein